MPVHCLRVAVGFAALIVAAAAAAEDAYYCVPLADVQFAEGKEKPRPPRADRWHWQARQNASTMRPYVALDGSGEVYADETAGLRGENDWSPPAPVAGPPGSPGLAAADSAVRRNAILVRTSQTGTITGRLYYPISDWSSLELYRFTVKLPQPGASARRLFYEAKAEHYQRLLDRNIPGGAWFRHEATVARAAVAGAKAAQPAVTGWVGRRPHPVGSARVA